MAKLNLEETMTELRSLTGTFPAVAGLIMAMEMAVADPMQELTVKAKAKPKPITLETVGDSILIKGTPWGKEGKALTDGLKRINGVKTQTIDPETGLPYYKTCFDKKEKAWKLSASKAAEVLDFFKEQGVKITAPAVVAPAVIRR